MKKQLDKYCLKFIIFLEFYWLFVLWIILPCYVSSLIYLDKYHLITLIWYPILLVISIVISFLVVIKFIIAASKISKPVPTKIKWTLFLFPYIMPIILIYRYIDIQEWDYSKFKSNDANECFRNQNFKYLPDTALTEECKLNSFKYLKLKFENVAIVHIDKNTTTFRIGSMDENAILGKDYILIQKNISYKWIGIYNTSFLLWQNGLKWLHKTNGSKIFHLVCWYSLAEKNCRKSIIRTIKTFKGNIYTKVFWRFDGMISWILRNFKQFKKISK